MKGAIAWINHKCFFIVKFKILNDVKIKKKLGLLWGTKKWKNKNTDKR